MPWLNYHVFFLPWNGFCGNSDTRLANRYSLMTHIRFKIILQWRIQEFCWGGVQQIQLRTEDRGQGERGSVGGSSLVRGSGGSCNLVQEISFHIVKFS